MPNVSETVYISANGSSAGKVMFAIPNQMAMKAKDLKGDDRDIGVTEENGKFKLIDPNRKIRTRKATRTLPGKIMHAALLKARQRKDIVNTALYTLL